MPDRNFSVDDDSEFDASDMSDVETSEEPARDEYVKQAAADLRRLFAERPEALFYQRQLQTMFEDRYFHWVTVRALEELVSQDLLVLERLPLVAMGPSRAVISIYRTRRYRYWRRAADEIVRIVSSFSAPAFMQALGAQGEMMFDAALPTMGFMPIGYNVRSVGNKQWEETDHDLDRIFERDGILYGTEIKNTLRYIEKHELETKVRMCGHLRLKPLFIVRMAPKSYVNFVRESGAFTLIYKYQLYPFGEKEFANTVRARLGLPVDVPKRIEQGTIQRLLNWHLKMLGRLST